MAYTHPTSDTNFDVLQSQFLQLHEKTNKSENQYSLAYKSFQKYIKHKSVLTEPLTCLPTPEKASVAPLAAVKTC